MTKHRSHSIDFKRQVAQEFIAGETLHGLAQRHDVSRNLIRIWVAKYEAGAFDEDAGAADLLQAYEAKIAALERLSALLTSLRGIDTKRHRWSAGRLWSWSF
jgi:transposase-like protein